MAKSEQCQLLLLVLSLVLAAAAVTQGARVQNANQHHHVASSDGELHLQGVAKLGAEENKYSNSRRLMIGSTKPICTYNECRGCKYRCRAEQVPVEGNDPINSAYHYRCVCHR